MVASLLQHLGVGGKEGYALTEWNRHCKDAEKLEEYGKSHKTIRNF